MNAHGQPDLLVTSACEDAAVGASVWLVYLNTGSGFATSPIRFALPPPQPAGCTTSNAVFDLNGDGLPDYVITSLCNDATVGSSRWLVYAGSAAGFAQATASYPLPPGFSSGTFATTNNAAATCTASEDVPAFSLFDITGDGIPDFIVTQACSDATVGTTAWLVYPGSSAGAAQTALRFALPSTPAVTAGAFDAVAGALSCTTSVTRPTFDLLDFDDDGKIDLVATAECASSGDTSVGTSSWLWYRNSGQGFASSPATIALPTISGAPTGSFTALSGAGTCAHGAGAPTYVLGDIDGDATIDLLVTRDCSDALTGVSYWKVFPSGGSGFTSSPRELALPLALAASASAPAGLSGASSCTAPARPAFTTTSLAGLRLDIVLTAVCHDSTVGDARWLVFPASCP